MKTELRVGLIGCGRAAERYYLPALGAFPNIEVAAAVDPVEERRRLVCARFRDCAPHAALDSGLIDRLDAGIITAPPGSHIPLAAAFLRRNRSVLVEKPLAPSLDGIGELREAAGSSEGFLMMGFNYRLWEPVVRLREELTREDLTDELEVDFTSDYSLWDPVSFVSDPLDDLGPHVLDLIRFIYKKEIRTLTAVSNGENGLEVTVRMPDDVRVHCRIAHCGETKRSIRSNGRFHVRGGSVRLRPAPGPVRSLLDLTDRIKTKLSGRTSPVKRTFELQLEKFFEGVRSGRRPDPGLEDGIAAIRAVEAARTSLEQNGREIRFDESA